MDDGVVDDPRDGALFRFLQLVMSKLDAVDARCEMGVTEPSGPVVHRPLPGRPGWRLVVTVREGADPEAAAEHLEALLGAFPSATDVTPVPPAAVAPRASAAGSTAPERLNRELGLLCDDCGALAAMVIDKSSPVLWGRSHDELAGESGMAAGLHDLLASDDAGPRIACAAHAARAVREALALTPTLPRTVHRGDGHGYFAKSLRALDGTYTLVLGFAGPFSDIAVDGAVRKRMGAIESLVASLPPLDPDPRPGRVISLRHR